MTYLPGGVRFDHSGVGGSIGLKGVNYSAFANAHKRTLEVTNRLIRVDWIDFRALRQFGEFHHIVDIPRAKLFYFENLALNGSSSKSEILAIDEDI